MVSLSPNCNRMSFSQPISDSDPESIHQNGDGIETNTTVAGSNFDGDVTRLLSSMGGSDAETLHMPYSGFVFKPLETISTGILLLICAVSLFIVCILIPIECESGTACHIKTMSMILYLHCLFWGIALICDQSIQYQHIKLRRRGYLEFYAEMRLLCQLPFWTISTWSTLLLSVSTILHDYCTPEGICSVFLPLKKSEYVTACIGIELIILIPLLFCYICKIWKFNSAKSLPDVLRHDEMTTLEQEYGQNSMGHINEEIYQRQADLILYYKEQNAMLRKTVLDLNHQQYNTPRCTPMA